MVAGTRAHYFMKKSMERKEISDRKQTMMATRIFNDILYKIQTSNLNFCLQISPFSANIALKKSLVTDKSGHVLLPDVAEPVDDNFAALVSHNEKLERENRALKIDHEKSVNECQDASKQIKELLEEVRILKAIKQEKS